MQLNILIPFAILLVIVKMYLKLWNNKELRRILLMKIKSQLILVCILFSVMIADEIFVVFSLPDDYRFLDPGSLMSVSITVFFIIGICMAFLFALDIVEKTIHYRYRLEERRKEEESRIRKIPTRATV